MYFDKRILLFLTLTFVNFLSFVTFSIQAPILPIEGHKVGASATQLGIVFGIYELANLIACPFIGTYAGRIGMCRTFCGGALVLGVSSILFGYVNAIHNPILFIVIACFLRIFEAIGAAAVDVGLYCIVGTIFVKNLATTVGIIESVYGVALSIGPYIGSALYEFGGFRLPFTATGFCVILAAIAAQCILQRITPNQSNTDSKEESDKKHEETNVITFLKIRPIVMNLSLVVMASIQLSGIAPLLEIHLRQFDLSPSAVGRVFLLQAGANAITTPIFAYLCGKIQLPEIVPLIGSLLYIIGYSILGPAPFTSLNPSLELTLTALTLLGIANASTLITGFVMSLDEARKLKIADDCTVSGAISSIYISSIATGCLIGPVVSGVLYDSFGFPYTTMVFFALATVQMGLIPFFVLWKEKYRKKLEKYDNDTLENDFDDIEFEFDAEINVDRIPLILRRGSSTKM